VRDRNPEGITLGELATRYLRGKKSDDRLVSVVTRYLIKSDLGAVKLDKVTSPMLLEAFAGYPDLSPQTRNHLRRHARAVFRYAIQRGLYRGADPASAVPRETVKRKPLVTLEAGEAFALVRLTKQPWRGILAVALHGLRKGEIWGLDLADVDIGRREMRVRRSHDHDTTKTSRERVVPIHPELLPMVVEACELAIGRGGPLFPGRRGKRRNERASVEVPFARALRLAKVRRHVRFHDLRHTAATLFLRAGVPMAHVSKILGHSSIRTTVDTYGHLVTEDLHAVIGRLSFRPEENRKVQK